MIQGRAPIRQVWVLGVREFPGQLLETPLQFEAGATVPVADTRSSSRAGVSGGPTETLAYASVR